MTAMIKVENLGKRYVLWHANRKQYSTLRESLYDGLRRLFSHAGRGGVQEREEFWALRHLSFEVEQGCKLGVIGRNGAGKSTLLKILSRITVPGEGKAFLNGRVASLLEVGTGFHPELTGRENIFLNGAIMGMQRTEIKKKFDEIVNFAEVEKFLDTPVKRYSSGMYVRLAFAVAAHLEPEILLIDEVLAVGDAEFQRKCLGKMNDISLREGRTIIFVSHNMPSIRTFCNRVLLLDRGQLKLDGEPTQVIGEYLAENQQQNSSVDDLLDFPRSAGNQRAITSAWLEDAEGRRVTQVSMGGVLKVCFRFRLTGKAALLNLGMGFENSQGERLFSLNNHMMNPSRPIANITQGVAELTINELPVMPGNYLISLSVVDSNRTWLDFIERALSVVVVPDDVYGSGKIPAGTQGVIYVRGDVAVREEA